jgi:hypothetical protein
MMIKQKAANAHCGLHHVFRFAPPPPVARAVRVGPEPPTSALFAPSDALRSSGFISTALMSIRTAIAYGALDSCTQGLVCNGPLTQRLIC